MEKILQTIALLEAAEKLVVEQMNDGAPLHQIRHHIQEAARQMQARRHAIEHEAATAARNAGPSPENQ